jgi:hypothetical protein
MVAAFPPPSFEEDQHVVLRAMSWQDFEAFLAIRQPAQGWAAVRHRATLVAW